MNRYYVREYGAIFERAFDDIFTAAMVPLQTMQTFTTECAGIGKAVISDILEAYMKERIIRPILSDIYR